MKVELKEETCPKCNGSGLQEEVAWCVEYCNDDPYACYKQTGKRTICKTCMGVKTVTILEVTE